MATTLEPWGETMPLLKIARHYGVDYAIPLLLADIRQHADRREESRRKLDAALVAAQGVPLDFYMRMLDDVAAVCDFVRGQRAQYKPSELRPIPGMGPGFYESGPKLPGDL